MNAHVTIEVATKDGMGFLKSCYCTPPFNVLDITEDKRKKQLHLMLMNASPGVLDGDAYAIKIDVAANSSLQLHTQSYQRLFQMKNGARQQLEIRLGEGASFTFVPHPAVPHKGAHFTTCNAIYLSHGCRLVWGEVLTCGRKGSGETFLFSRYHSVTKLFLENRLVVKENLLLQPLETDLTGMGQLEGYTHQASLLCLHETFSKPHIAQALHDWLSLQNGICFGISALPVAGLVVRILGHKGEQLFDCLQQLAERLPAHTITAKPAQHAC